MFCPNCGKRLPGGATFCSGCGARLGTAPAAAPVSGAPARTALSVRDRRAPWLLLAAVALAVLGVVTLARYVGSLGDLNAHLALFGTAHAAIGALLLALFSLGIALGLVDLAVRCLLSLRRHAKSARLLPGLVALMVVCVIALVCQLAVFADPALTTSSVRGIGYLVFSSVGPWARDALVLLVAVTVLVDWLVSRERAASGARRDGEAS